MKKTIFISYDYDNDRDYKNMLKAWDANKNFDLSFDDGSADVSIKSHDVSVIKRAISAKINNSTYFLCIVGKSTCKSDWVEWEIDKAVELKRKIVAVKISKDNQTSTKLYNINATWALSFTRDGIIKAVEDAK